MILDPIGAGEWSDGSDTWDEFPDLAPDLSTIPCPNRVGIVFLYTGTGESFRARCGLLGCDPCLPRNAFRRAVAVAWAKPERTITLTLVADADDPDPFQCARRRVNRVRERLVSQGVAPGEWQWFVERNPELTGCHAHVAQWGSFIPFGALQSAAQWAGCGRWTRIEAIRDPANLSRYALKELGLANYGVKGFNADRDDDERREALRINGGRLGHGSHRFWRDHRDGSRIKGVRNAERVAFRGMLDDGDRPPGHWIMCTDEAAATWPSVMGRRDSRALEGRFVWDGRVDQVKRWRSRFDGKGTP